MKHRRLKPWIKYTVLGVTTGAATMLLGVTLYTTECFGLFKKHQKPYTLPPKIEQLALKGKAGVGGKADSRILNVKSGQGIKEAGIEYIINEDEDEFEVIIKNEINVYSNGDFDSCHVEQDTSSEYIFEY